MKKLIFKARKLLICLILSFIGILAFYETHDETQSKPIYLAPPEIIKHFAFGFPDLYADLLWIRLVQDIDFCNSEAGTPVYDGKNMYQCETGWSYRMADAITELSPRFLKAYKVSASIMSVVMRDKIGAKNIYDKGVRQFPTDWNLHYGAAYHYLLEIKDKRRAAELLTVAVQNGGPQWIYALVAKQYKDLNEYGVAHKILSDYLKESKGTDFEPVIKKRLQELEEKIKESKDVV